MVENVRQLDKHCQRGSILRRRGSNLDCVSLGDFIRRKKKLMSCVFIRYVHDKAAIITPLTKKLLK